MAETMSINEANQAPLFKDPAPAETGDYENDFETDGQSTTMSVGTGVSSRGYISLSRISKNHVKIKSSSSFPNLLSLYQTPIREETILERKERKERKRRGKQGKKQKEEEIKKLDWEEYHEIRNRQEQRMLRVNTVAKEQLDKFDEYVAKMNKKVEKQREERKKYNENLQERLRQQQEMERKKLRLHRGPKHNFIHDRSYLKTLPASNFCKTTRLADELQRKGVLRTKADVEKFWAGYAERQRRGIDIFANDSKHSVNYPNQWMGTSKPEIRIEGDDDSITEATEVQPTPSTQLPPIKKRKKKRRTPQE